VDAIFTIPMLNSVGYSTFLRSVSSGEIEFNISNYGYDYVNNSKQKQVIFELTGRS
jgi:translation elongation factor EF-G